ncbi:amidohydrolase [Falsigemmobacter intermedius]|uniref:amidohydrolase n=1 Tax=Falsigemmobacter intermedius TaxID=1553448 RepID=UPI003EFBE3B9
MTAVADLILHNGRIWRGKAEGYCEALAVWQGRVLATGSPDEIMALKGAATEVIDLEGRFASPGLIDNHLHLLGTGFVMGMVNATPAFAPTVEDLIKAIAERAKTTPKGQWIRARGYDQTKYPTGAHPTRDDLDLAAPDHPVLVTRACGHITIANSKALELGGITDETPDPDGGVIGRSNGRLNGLLAENAMDLVYSVVPTPTTEQLIDAIEAGGNYLLSLGITSCMDAAVGQIAGLEEMRAYEFAKLAGRLPVRVWLTLLGDPSKSIVEDCYRMGLVSGAGDDLLRVGAVKLFLDGSAGGRTAWMSEAYQGQPDNFGVQMLPDDYVYERVQDLHDKGYALACHAIGDKAIEQLITAYEKALEKTPDVDRRHRIEHCGFPKGDQNDRMKAAGILPAPQQAFIYDFGDAYVSVLGEERGLKAFPIGTWERMGMKPSTGSDSPVCLPNPFPNLYALITRKTWKGTVMDETEVLARDTALQVLTEYGAYSQKAEGVKGRLVPGQLADIAVFSGNLLEDTPEVILNDTKCVLTLLEGRVVYDAR